MRSRGLTTVVGVSVRIRDFDHESTAADVPLHCSPRAGQASRHGKIDRFNPPWHGSYIERDGVRRESAQGNERETRLRTS